MTPSLEVKEATYNERGYHYKGWQVTGTVNGKRIRIRCRDKAHAQMVKVQEETKGINTDRRMEWTNLTPAQIQDAEVTFEHLASKATLTELFEFWHSQHANRGEKVTLGDAIMRFLRHEEPRVRPATWEQKKQTLNKFASHVDQDLPINEVSHKTVIDYLDSLRAVDGVNMASSKYWNNSRIVLHAFFEWTTERPQEFTARNVVSDIHAKKIEQGEIETLTVEQSEKLMQHVASLKGGKYARFFALALFAGIRPDVRGGELNKLEENDIDLVHGVIKVRASVSKTGKNRQVMILPNLLSWLKKYADQPLNGITEHAYRSIKAKLFPGHDILRHTFCSYHLATSGSFADTAMQAGNSEKILRDHYVNRVTKEAALKFWAILPE